MNVVPITHYVLDPEDGHRVNDELIVLAARILKACLDSPERESVLIRSTWRHQAEIPNPHGDHLPTILSSASMTQTMTRTILTLTRGSAPDIVFRFEHNLDDPERAIAVNQCASTSLESIRRHQEAIDELSRQIGENPDLMPPGDAMTTTARAFALAETVDPSRDGRAVTYSAPWRHGPSGLIDEADGETLPIRTRWWRHGNVTTVREEATQGKSGRTFVIGPLRTASPIDVDPLEQMRLILIAEESR